MAASYGYDISRPRGTAREAVQWLYFAYLGAVKEQNGAAMSLGPHVDLPRRATSSATSTRAGSPRPRRRSSIDDFVIKLRIVRFLRTPEYDALFSRRPDLGHRVDRRHGRGRPHARHQHVVPLPADALQPRARPRAEPHGAVERRAARGVQGVLRAGLDRHVGDPVRDRRPDPRQLRRRLRDRLLRVGDARSASRCSSSAPASTSPRRCSTRSTAAATRSPASRWPRPRRPVAGRRARLRRRAGTASTTLLDWLAETYVDALNFIHYMHDKYAYERLEMALHDRDVLRTMACGIAGLVGRGRLAVGDQVRAASRPVRDEPGLVVDYVDRGRVPDVRQRRRPRRRASRSTWSASSWRKIRQQPTYRDAIHTQSVLTITSNVVYGKHTGNTPDGRRAGRAVRPGRQPDERPRLARHDRQRAARSQAALRRRRRTASR